MAIISSRKIWVVVTALVVLSSLLLAACADESDYLGPTTSTTLFPSQRQFEQELSGTGYDTAAVFTVQEEDTPVLLVWVGVEVDTPGRASNDAIFDHATTLATKYGATDSTGGRLRVELFKLEPGPVKDHIFESRDFDLAGVPSAAGLTAVDTTASHEPSNTDSTDSLVTDGVWELQVDRQGGSEDFHEAFGFLPEAAYRPVEHGPTYRVVISEQGMQASVEGMRGTTQFAVTAKRTSIADDLAWYELTDAFAGGRFVVWRSETGLQGELTVYGSGLPIIFSERGALVKNTSADDPLATTDTPVPSLEETAQAQVALLTFFEAWAAKDWTAYEGLLTERRRHDMHAADWTSAERATQVAFGEVVEAPEGIYSYMTYGRGRANGVHREDVRCFRATITWYYPPGVVGPTESGQGLPWMWFLVREADGNWRVDDWGA